MKKIALPLLLTLVITVVLNLNFHSCQSNKIPKDISMEKDCSEDYEEESPSQNNKKYLFTAESIADKKL